MRGDFFFSFFFWLKINYSVYECTVYQWFWSDWSRLAFLFVFLAFFVPRLLSPSWLWFPRRPEKRLTSHELWAEELWSPWRCITDSALSLCPVSQSCAFSPFQPEFDYCTVTQPTLQRAAQASSTLPLEGALRSKLHREKWFWFYWEYKKNVLPKNTHRLSCVLFPFFFFIGIT